MIGGPVATTDQMPLGELDEANALYHEGTAFRYENFTHDRQQAQSQAQAPRRRGSGFSNSLLANSTVSFAEAFASNLISPTAQKRGADYTSPAATNHGVSAYEMMSSVIHHEIEPLGEKLSLTL